MQDPFRLPQSSDQSETEARREQRPWGSTGALHAGSPAAVGAQGPPSAASSAQRLAALKAKLAEDRSRGAARPGPAPLRCRTPDAPLVGLLAHAISEMCRLYQTILLRLYCSRRGVHTVQGPQCAECAGRHASPADGCFTSSGVRLQGLQAAGLPPSQPRRRSAAAVLLWGPTQAQRNPPRCAPRQRSVQLHRLWLRRCRPARQSGHLVASCRCRSACCGSCG